MSYDLESECRERYVICVICSIDVIISLFPAHEKM